MPLLFCIGAQQPNSDRKTPGEIPGGRFEKLVVHNKAVLDSVSLAIDHDFAAEAPVDSAVFNIEDIAIQFSQAVVLRHIQSVQEVIPYALVVAKAGVAKARIIVEIKIPVAKATGILSFKIFKIITKRLILKASSSH